MIFWNVLQFWKMYGGAGNISKITLKPKLLINKWVLLKLEDTIRVATAKLDNYDIVGAARNLENFVAEDISRWYVRRIRDAMKENSAASKETGAILGYLLGEISKLLAPFAPFTAEKIWMELGNQESVHLVNWPKLTGQLSKAQVLQDLAQTDGASRAIRQQANMRVLAKIGAETKAVLDSMQEVRKIVGLALEARAKLGIKVRQPLGSLSISDKNKVLGADYLELVKDEINVKEIKFMELPADVLIALDTNITPALREEGILRDLIREIQSARKTAGLKPKDKVAATLELPKEIFGVAKKNENLLLKETNLKSIKILESAETKIVLK